MPRRLFAPRAVLIGLTISFSLMAGGYWAARDGETFAPTLWPVVYGLVAALCALTLARPDRTTAIVAGALATLGVLSRLAGIIWNLIEGVYPEPGRAVAGFGLIPMGAMCLLFVFDRGIVPWATGERARRGR